MAVSYVGSRIELLAENDHDPFFEISTREQVWRIAQPDASAWWNGKAPGTAWAGGYIVDRNKRDSGPYVEISLVIAQPPNFNAVQTSGAFGLQTASKSATVVTNQVIDGATSVDASRQISFYAYSRVFRYYTSRLPSRPRYTSAVLPAPIRVADITRVTVAEGTATGAKSRTFGSSLPTPLTAALSIPTVTLVTSFDFEPITGTPWFRCTDTVSNVYYQS